MTEKQYKLGQWTSSSLYYSFPDGNLHHSIGEVIARVENDLNSLYNDNEQLKQQNKKYMLMMNCNSDLNDEIYQQLKKTEKNYKSLLKENEQLKSELAKIKRQEQEVIEYLQAYHNGDVNELKKELRE